MFNSLFRHIAKHKLGYILTAVAIVFGVTAWSYNRIPDFEALELAGRVGRVPGASIKVLAPNGGETFQVGDTVKIAWKAALPATAKYSKKQTATLPFNVYLVREGSKKDSVQVAKNVRGTSYSYKVSKTGKWRFIVAQGKSMDQSDRPFEIMEMAAPEAPAFDEYAAPAPETRLEADTASPTTGCNLVNADVCENREGGIYVEKFSGSIRGTLTNDCRDAGHGMRLYNANCTSPTQYRVCWEPCLPTAVEPGTLSFRQTDSPQSSIMVAGTTRQLVAQYEAQAAREAFNIHELTVINDLIGSFDAPVDTFAVNRVYVEYTDARGVTQTASQSIVAGTVNFNLDTPVYVPGDEVTTIRIYADIQSTSYGQTLSGQYFRLGLKENNPESADGTFRAVGGGSGFAIYNPVISGSDGVYDHVVRFTKPTVTRGCGDAPLMDGDTDLYCVTVAADPARSLEVKSMTFLVSAVMGAGDSVSSFRVREGVSGSDMETSEATIYDADRDIDLHRTATNYLEGNSYDGFVVVNFVATRPVAPGSSKTFVLKATVSGANNDDRIATYIPADAGPSISADAARMRELNSNFIWSDKSYTSPVHSEETPDWTNGYLVETFPTPARTLSY